MSNTAYVAIEYINVHEVLELVIYDISHEIFQH